MGGQLCSLIQEPPFGHAHTHTQKHPHTHAYARSHVHLTPHLQLQDLGFARLVAVEAFLAADRNEEVAANMVSVFYV